MVLPSLALLAALAAGARGDVSIYPTAPVQTAGVYTGYPAYNPGTLPPPQLQLAAPQTPQFDLALTAAAPQNLGPQTPGSLFGFSIEMSIADAVIGRNKTVVWPEFLNLMEALKARGGVPVLRVGGNSQEKAVLVDSLTGGDVIQKSNTGPTGITQTPTIHFTRDILDAMRTVSDFLGVQWYMGIPFDQVKPARFDVVAAGNEILGDYLVAWQLGNEPDLYQSHGFRGSLTQNYTEIDYISDFQTIVDQYKGDSRFPNKKTLGGPSVCCIWNETYLNSLNYFDTFSDVLSTIIIEHYPTDNCFPDQHDLNVELTHYLQHSAATSFADRYNLIWQRATQLNLPVVLLETNTASCNGFLGISDAFASALWAVDVSLQLGFRGLKHLMMHMGGQGVLYNPFVPAPFNGTAPWEWTVGNIFYSALMVAEALGPSGTARIVDLQANTNAQFTPAYAIYEGSNPAPARVVLINYMDAATGGQKITANIKLDNGLPGSVRVRYLSAPSVVSKYNTTYGGRSFGGQFQVDGILRGQDDTRTVTCANGACSVDVPAPGAALVFLTDTAFSESVPDDSAVQSFPTTYESMRHGTATLEQVVLETSNGMSGQDRKRLSSTSFGSKSDAPRRVGISVVAVVVGVVGVSSWMLMM